MNILRGGVAAIFTLVFLLSSVAFVAGFSLEQTITPRGVATIIERSMVGRRVGSALPGMVAQYLLETENIKLRAEDVSGLIGDVLRPQDIDHIVVSFSSGLIEYVRGRTDVVPSIDLAPVEARAVFVSKKRFPGMYGEQLTRIIKTQFKKIGSEKEWIMPREGLNRLKMGFSEFAIGVKLALFSLIVSLLVIFSIAPHGLHGRLRWGGTVFMIAGFIMSTVALGASVASTFVVNSEFKGNTPPQIVDAVKVGLDTMSEIFAKNVLVAAIICLGLGSALAILGHIFHKRETSFAPKNSGQILET